MAVGFVLITTIPGKEHEVYRGLTKIGGISYSQILFGEYDIISKVEAADFGGIGRIVVDKIRTIPGVVDTKTLTGIQL